MTGHIERRLLERFVLAPASIEADERRLIALHLDWCALCREERDAIASLHGVINTELQSPPTGRDHQTARRILAASRGERSSGTLLPEHSDMLSTSQLTVVDSHAEVVRGRIAGFVDRAYRYVRLYPIRSAAAMFALTSIAVAFILTQAPKDTNPASGGFKDGVLTVYNKAHEPLWTKEVKGMPDGAIGEPFAPYVAEYRISDLIDVTGNGSNHILLAGPDRESNFASDTIYCFNPDGSLLWKSGVGRMIAMGLGGQGNQTTSITVNIAVLRLDGVDRARLFVLALDRYFSPTKFIELDPATGNHLQAYYNRGHTEVLNHLDIDNDGKEELILGGVNDGYDRACLIGLDPNSFGGYSPTPPQFRGEDAVQGREKFYMLFPKSELMKRFAGVAYNILTRIVRTKGGGIVARCQENIFGLPEGIGPIGILFSIRPGLKVDYVVGDDVFLKANSDFVTSGKLPKSLLPDGLDALKDSVLYWNGSQFVNTPYIRHTAAKPLPPS